MSLLGQAHCCYELAQATGSKEEYEEAFHVLEEREKWLQDKDDKRILAVSTWTFKCGRIDCKSG